VIGRRWRTAVFLIFVLSGAAGLIYEVVWSRQLVLVFGNTTQAVSTILTGFFGGMAIGSWGGGRVADRVRSPLRMYGVIELVLVVVVILTPVTFRILHEAYRGIYPALVDTPWLALVRFGLAILALAPATILMGATLPALTRALTLASGEHLSGAFSRLYAANIVGAILGTALAGFVLIELLGLTGTLVVGAALSATAGVTALGLARSPFGRLASRSEAEPAEALAASPEGPPEAVEAPPQGPAGPTATAADHPIAPRPRLALVVAFVSGLTSLGYQVLWTRLLSSGTGGSTYVFTGVLVAFLIGLAVGAVAFALLRSRVRQPLRLLAGTNLATAILALVGVAIVLPAFATTKIEPETVVGLVGGAALLVVLPTAVVIGISFPASSTLLEGDPARVARLAGLLLAVNTVGSICGTFLIPFVVIPAVGSPAAVALLASINAAMAIGIAALAGRPSGGRRPAEIATIAVASIALVAGPLLVTSGRLTDPSITRVTANGGTIARAAEDEIASVQAGHSIGEQLWVAGTSMTLLTVDAKLMPVIPLMARPDAKTILIVAFGMGSSYRSALVAGLQVEGVELVPSVPRMFDIFYPDARQVLANDRGSLVIADGRNHLELANETWDLIMTDPPPPTYSSGASVISSLEYFQAGRRHLNPGGLMMQWLPYGPKDDEFRAHVRTFRAVFPEVTILQGPGRWGVLMLGSDAPISLDEPAIRSILERPGVIDDLSSAYDSPERTLEGWERLIPTKLWLRNEQVDAYAGDGPLITDDRPYPEYFLLRTWLGGS
jgi:spermidine synthase